MSFSERRRRGDGAIARPWRTVSRTDSLMVVFRYHVRTLTGNQDPSSVPTRRHPRTGAFLERDGQWAMKSVMSESSLESLNDQAALLLRDTKRSEPTAVERVLTHHPEWRRFWRSRKAFELDDAQTVIACEHGFETFFCVYASLCTMFFSFFIL